MLIRGNTVIAISKLRVIKSSNLRKNININKYFVEFTQIKFRGGGTLLNMSYKLAQDQMNFNECNDIYLNKLLPTFQKERKMFFPWCFNVDILMYGKQAWTN